MKWVTALFFGIVMGFMLPLFFGGRTGVWLNSFASYGTIRPLPDSPGLLFSIPVFLGAAVALRLLFNWHTR